MKKIHLKISVFLVLFMAVSFKIVAQTLQHPTIYATAADRSRIIDLINTQTWAKSIETQLKANVDAKLTTHQTNPNAIFSTLTPFPPNDDYSEADANPLATAHNKVLTTASYSAMLYYISQDEKYAKFAGDILNYYIDTLQSRTAATTSICGNYFYDPRTTFTHFALTYDFIYNYLKLPTTTVYNKPTGTRVAFNNTKAQKALSNIVANALFVAGGGETNGRFISNHHVLTAPGTLFPILCIEDDTERERLFKIFWETGTKRQAAFKNTVLQMFGEQGIWPESTSYSFMPNIPLVLNVVDRIKPQLNIGTANQSIFDGVFLFENLRNPNRVFVRYGDSKRSLDATDDSYRYVLNISKRLALTQLQSKAEIALKQLYDATSGGYKPVLPSSIFDNYVPLELFWGEKLPNTTVSKFDYKPTVLIKHAGVALQRNHVDNQNSIYGLCGIIGGAHYVHSHCTGISMELYGANYVMGPNGGLPESLAERSLPEHRNYFMRHAGNNTVIVNGVSVGRQSGSWASNIYIWQNTTVNIGAEPAHLEEPLSKNFSFATQFLKDEVNNCDQQRTLSTIRTSETTGYYFDMFRSKSLGTNNFHDYIYHNLGDETLITNATNTVLPVSATTRYQTDVGDPVQSPGWRFFESTQVTAPTSEAVKIRFKIAYDNRYMHMFMPSGASKEYTKALGPATREAPNGYVSKKTQIVAIRQAGEAWEKPFVSIFEPSTNEQPSVQSVEPLNFNNATVGAIVRSNVQGKEITDYVICNKTNTSTVNFPDINLNFKGRFAVVRREVIGKVLNLTLYIGEGELLSFGKDTLNGGTEKKGILVINDISLSLDTTKPIKSGDAKLPNIEVFPNPANKAFTIKISELKWRSLNIYNTQGHKVYSDLSGEDTVKVIPQEHNMTAGLYIIELVDRRFKRVTYKLMIQD